MRSGAVLVTLAAGLVAGCSKPDGAAGGATAAGAAGAAAGAPSNRSPSADAGEVRRAIEAANARYTDAATRGDVAGLTANYAPDALVMNPGAPALRGREAVEKGFAGLASQLGVDAMRLHTEDVLVGGDLAVETGTYAETFRPKAAGAKPFSDAGKYVSVWRRQTDGSWKIVRDIYNSDAPPPEL
jgi:uncharacterized protein (TIGR02246 family)